MKTIISLILILIFSFQSYASLLFAGDNDRVEYTSNSAWDLDTTGTLLLWIYITDDTQRQGIIVRSNPGNAYYEIVFRGDQAGDYFFADRQRGTTDAAVQSNAANFSTYGLNKWVFIGFVFNTGGAGTDQKLYMGDMTTKVAEPSSYTTQTVGSGTVNNTYGTNNMFVGSSTVLTREFRGRIAWTGVWNTAMTLEQVAAQQYHPNPTSGVVLFSHLGFPNTECPDFSGQAAVGTVTSATNALHVPLGNYFGF